MRTEKLSVLVVVAIFIEPYTTPLTIMYWFGEFQDRDIRAVETCEIWYEGICNKA
ncbi:hypothetical protein DPMN_073283 [Dreissena polymorpha]|uniref:Uncharacterized protein n=1 Tax=Dreissena polymorpha TaxID=45954 RepID=A0A9D4BYW5_DREPO|nr:hypothetical protein DPMN_073283 [Dreissena polymorpha]